MTRRRKTVTQLAQEANMDVDEALITLWDAGYDNITRPSDALGNVSYARRILGVASRRDLKFLSYWMFVFNFSEADLRNLLYKLAVPIATTSDTLPPKAMTRLRAEARKRGINPLTGKTTFPQDSPLKAKTFPQFTWHEVGHLQELRWLTEDEVVKIHFELVSDFAGSSDPVDPPGVRSDSLLASAVFRPQTALGSTLKYPTVEMSAAALLYGVIHDHPFHNGNKRTALVCTLAFLDENGIFPEFDQDEAFKLVLDIAQHRIVTSQRQELPDRETLAIAEWLCKHCRLLKKTDYVIPCRKLRNILNAYGCEIEITTNNHMRIRRQITERRLRIFERRRTLHTHITYHGENSDISKSAVRKVRKDLQLDEYHGVDSDVFYSKEPIRPSDFIARYRKTLMRLARW